MQVPQPQDWQRHGCCSEGLQGHCKNLTQLRTGLACERAHTYYTGEGAVWMHIAENMPVHVRLWIIESLVLVLLTCV